MIKQSFYITRYIRNMYLLKTVRNIKYFNIINAIKIYKSQRRSEFF